jgi:hypothetical protein
MHLAGLSVSAMSASRAVAEIHGLPSDDETLQNVAAYLVEKFLESCETLDPKAFAEWRASAIV